MTKSLHFLLFIIGNHILVCVNKEIIIGKYICLIKFIELYNVLNVHVIKKLIILKTTFLIVELLQN